MDSSSGALPKCTDKKTAVPFRASLMFTIDNHVGALDDCLAVLRGLGISLSKIDSRPSKTAAFDYDILVDFDSSSEDVVDKAAEGLRPVSKSVKVISSSPNVKSEIPWFPRKLVDLDTFAEKVLEMGEELDSDHPGAKDLEYRARRAEITRLAKTFRTGNPIPRVEYTKEEIGAWAVVFEKLTELHKRHACREHQYVFPLLVHNCHYNKENIPQLEDISNFLKDCTGFTLRPVMGLLTSRDFLNGLAFRVFHSTQYIRHPSKPLYTPEPDICHEVLGHVPLFCDPDFADFSQEVGLASLGASDADIEKLSTIYWFTVEFGVCRQDNEIKAYGAGLLSSFGELEYSMSDKPKLLPFDVNKVSVQKYPITEYQPIYFVTESFKDAKEQVRQFAAQLSRPFSVRYNPYTQSIEVLDNKDKVLRFALSIQHNFTTLLQAIDKLP